MLAPVVRGRLPRARPQSVCLINNAATCRAGRRAGHTRRQRRSPTRWRSIWWHPSSLANLFCRRLRRRRRQMRRIINVSSGAAQSGTRRRRTVFGRQGGAGDADAAARRRRDSAGAFARSPCARASSTPACRRFMRTQPATRLAKRRHVPGIPRQRSAGRAARRRAAKIVDKLVLGEVGTGRTYRYKEL